MNSTIESWNSNRIFMWHKEGIELTFRSQHPEYNSHQPHHTNQANWLRYTTQPLGLGFIARITGVDDSGKIGEEGICISFHPE